MSGPPSSQEMSLQGQRWSNTIGSSKVRPSPSERIGPERFRDRVSAAAILYGTRFATTAVLAGECACPSEDADQTDRLSQRAVGVGGLVGTSGRMFGITSLGLSCSEAVQALRNV